MPVGHIETAGLAGSLVDSLVDVRDHGSLHVTLQVAGAVEAV